MNKKKISERLRWFQEARFGMFIHWGVYSVPARGEWVMYRENIPVDEYVQYAKKFNPKRFNADEWVKLAKDAGMKYIILTTRHHDGFSLFDSKVSDFTSVRTSAKRDFVAEYVRACRKAGMKIGFYYSLIDWRWPTAFKGPEKDPKGWGKLVQYVHAQVKELCTQYGKIDILWYDGQMYMDLITKRPYPRSPEACFLKAEDWNAKELNRMVRRYQPGILINDRSGLPEDFDTPEQSISPSKPGRLWESCMTMNIHWGYTAADSIWKSPKQLVHNLARCVSGGGNYLLNVGPKSDGTIPNESVKRLQKIGKWLKVNGEAIYGAGRAPFEVRSAGMVTAKGRNIYLIVYWWPGKKLILPRVRAKIKSAYILPYKQQVSFETKGERVILKNLPSKAPDPLSTVIVIKI